MKNFVKHFKKLSIILWLIPSTAYAEFRHFNNWTTEEKALYTGYATVAYIDHRQTRAALSDPCECYQEANPLYGSNPHKDKSIAINAAVLGLIYYGVGASKEDDFNPFLLGGLLGRTAVVIHNDSVGVSWRVAF